MAGVCAGWTSEAGDRNNCQFDDESPDHEFEGRSYCRFHLPMGEPGDGGKADWDDDDKEAISHAIIERIKAETEKPEIEREALDFRGTVVPKIFMLGNETVWEIDFSGARFHDMAYFQGARFQIEANFGEARFHEGAYFRNARFHGVADFEKVRFDKSAFFGEARFHESAVFEGARFGWGAIFTGSPDISQSQARQFNDVSFAGAQFGGSADFSNREFLARTDFSSCVFGEAPNFHGSALHQDTEFGGIDCFPDVTSHGAERAYCTLRLAMEQLRARPEEGMFFALEQKARRHGMSRRDPAYWLSLFYEKGSDYGLSILRPLGWFLGGVVASTFVLYSIGFYEDGLVGGAGRSAADMAAKAADALQFSARQAFLPFDALRSKDEVLGDYDFNPWGTGWLRVWGTVLTLFEGLAALLLILAVRWRYRR